MAIIFVECIHVLFLSYCNEFTNYTILYLSDQWVPSDFACSELAIALKYIIMKNLDLDLSGLS
jgi:hypothetical protein